jgi:putative proteasome-type protease
MTYCLGIITRHGLVISADSRTNAGVDYISTYQKLFDFSNLGERVIILCVSGNLSITQAVINAIEHDLQHHEGDTLHSLPTMYDLARYVGSKVRIIQERERPWLEKDRIDYHCTLLLGGQIAGQDPQLYMIYSQGNFIQATPETPFLQIGETKYGKPILDRTITFDTSLEDAAKCALLSIDSTMKSNISVGPPINLMVYYRDTLKIRHQLKLKARDPYLSKIRKMWEDYLRQAFEKMPQIEWDRDEIEEVEEIIGK